MKRRKKPLVITIANMKGGVGKSTTALTMYSCLKELGYRCLFIDTDPQCNSSMVFRADMGDGIPTLYDLFFSNGEYTFKEIVQQTEYGDIIPSDAMLQEADTKIKSSPKMYKYLYQAIQDMSEQYDIFLIDTPPATGILTGNAFYASDYVICPVDTSLFAVQGLLRFYEVVQEFQEDREAERPLVFAGLLLIKYKSRFNLSNDILDSLENTAQMMHCKVFRYKIRESVRVQEAQVLRIPLAEYAKESTTYQDYMLFTKEFLEDIGE